MQPDQTNPPTLARTLLMAAECAQLSDYAALVAKMHAEFGELGYRAAVAAVRYDPNATWVCSPTTECRLRVAVCTTQSTLGRQRRRIRVQAAVAVYMFATLQGSPISPKQAAELVHSSTKQVDRLALLCLPALARSMTPACL